MGDVVSIRQSTDDDLQTLFSKACPEIPGVVSEKVQLAASHTVGSGPSIVYQPSFKTVCLIIAGASLLGAGLVKGFATRWSTAVDSAAMYTVQAEQLNKEAVLGAALPAVTDSAESWERSRGAWAEYIARLERDPFYRYVQQEKMRFEARYPGESSTEFSE